MISVRTIRRQALTAVIWVLLAAVTVLFVLPVYWMLSTSFQASDKLFSLPIEWLPSVLHTENYPNALSRAAFPRYFLNSLVVSLAVMAGNLVLGTLAGYGLAKYRIPGLRVLLLLILCTLMLPIEVVIVPTFLVVKQFDWLNSYQGLAAPFLVDAFGIYLMRQFILGVPTEYVEAARIDGAGELHILLRIVVPQCLPALATLAIFSFRDSWDLFIWPLVVISRDEWKTLPLGFVRFTDDYVNSQTEQMAIATLAMLPVIVLLVFLQRSFVRGFAQAGLK